MKSIRLLQAAVATAGFAILLSGTSQSEPLPSLDRNWNDAGRILADSAALRVPHQIAVDGDTVLYVADTNGERIRKYARR